MSSPADSSSEYSRLLARLDSEILSAKSPVDAACIRAERAGVYARLGRVELARNELEILSEFNGSRSILRLSVLISLSKGLLSYYCDHIPSARNWVLRAVALSRAASSSDLMVLPLAWLAHVELESDNLKESMAALHECLARAAPDDLPSRARASVVASVVNGYIGRFAEALECSKRARFYASSQGDESIHASLMANMAAFRISRLRLLELSGDILGEDIAAASALADSSANFDRGLDLRGSVYLTDASRAELLARKGDYKGALDLYSSTVESSLKIFGNRREAYMLSDMAWCYYRLHESDSAINFIRKAEACLKDVTHLDDRVVVCGQLARIYCDLGHEGSAEKYSAQYHMHLKQLNVEREWLLSKLQELPSL